MKWAEAVNRVTHYAGEVSTHTQAGGTPRQLLDVHRLNSIGWKAQTSLVAGLEKVYIDYRAAAQIGIS
jgi:GDP-L-fucose synthase